MLSPACSAPVITTPAAREIVDHITGFLTTTTHEAVTAVAWAASSAATPAAPPSRPASPPTAWSPTTSPSTDIITGHPHRR
jgi:hypothetical protein